MPAVLYCYAWLAVSSIVVAEAVTSITKQQAMYASSPGNSDHCYAELVVSSLTVAEIIAGTKTTHAGMARLSGLELPG